WIGLFSAGPGLDGRPSCLNPRCQILHATSFRRVVTGKKQSQPLRTSGQVIVKTHFAGDQHVCGSSNGIYPEFAARATRDGNPSDRAMGVTNELNLEGGQLLFHGSRELGKRKRPREHSEAPLSETAPGMERVNVDGGLFVGV